MIIVEGRKGGEQNQEKGKGEEKYVTSLSQLLIVVSRGEKRVYKTRVRRAIGGKKKKTERKFHFLFLYRVDKEKKREVHFVRRPILEYLKKERTGSGGGGDSSFLPSKKEKQSPQSSTSPRR